MSPGWSHTTQFASCSAVGDNIHTLSLHAADSNNAKDTRLCESANLGLFFLVLLCVTNCILFAHKSLSSVSAPCRNYFFPKLLPTESRFFLVTGFWHSANFLSLCTHAR